MKLEERSEQVSKNNVHSSCSYIGNHLIMSDSVPHRKHVEAISNRCQYASRDHYENINCSLGCYVGVLTNIEEDFFAEDERDHERHE